jgi:cell division protein FtsL
MQVVPEERRKACYQRQLAAISLPVSNSNMRLLRFVKWAALVVAVSAVIVVSCVSVYLRMEQYRFRRQAEQLLSDVRELELQKASAAQVKVVVKKWGFKEWGQGPSKPCTEDACIYRFQLVPKARQGDIGADPFVWGPMARALECLGLRLAVVQAWVQIRGKALQSISFTVWTVGRGCDGSGCTLMGEVSTKSEGGSWSAYDQPDAKLKQSLLHPTYLVGTFPALFNADTGGSPSVVIWAEFSQDASSADISRLMQFDLSCLTRLISCRNRDLMPTVWGQSVVDVRESPKGLACTPELSKEVAQIADVIAVVRPKTVELDPPPYNGRTPRLRDL